MASFHVAEEVLEAQGGPSGANKDQVIASIQQGLADIEAGRVISHEDLRAELEAEFGPLDV